MNDIIITGIPRGGTTLAAAILDQAPNCICLSEPDKHVELMLASSSKIDFINKLEIEFSSIRSNLITGGKVMDRRQVDGSPVTNYFGSRLEKNERPSIFTIQSISRSNLSDDFKLGVKHNALYVAVLPEIIKRKRFKIIAIIRHPIDVITSWMSLKLPVSQGYLPAADRYWCEMQILTHSDVPLLDKQLLIYELICERLLKYQDYLQILRYEDMVQCPELLLTKLGISTGDGFALTIPIIVKKQFKNLELIKRWNQLMESGDLKFTKRLYPKEIYV